MHPPPQRVLAFFEVAQVSNLLYRRASSLRTLRIFHYQQQTSRAGSPLPADRKASIWENWTCQRHSRRAGDCPPYLRLGGPPPKEGTFWLVPGEHSE